MARPTVKCDTLEEVLEVLSQSKFPDLVWVGRAYSKADLIRDLKQIKGKS